MSYLGQKDPMFIVKDKKPAAEVKTLHPIRQAEIDHLMQLDRDKVNHAARMTIELSDDYTDEEMESEEIKKLFASIPGMTVVQLWDVFFGLYEFDTIEAFIEALPWWMDAPEGEYKKRLDLA